MALWTLPRLSRAAEDLSPSEFLLDLYLCKRKHFWNQQPCPEAQLKGTKSNVPPPNNAPRSWGKGLVEMCFLFLMDRVSEEPCGPTYGPS